MGSWERFKKRYFERDPDEPVKDPYEKGGSLGLRVFILLLILVVLLAIEWWRGLYDELWGWTVLGISMVISATTIASYIQLAIANNSRLLIDMSGMRVPILKEKPILLDVSMDETGNLKFPMELLLVDQKTGKMVVSNLVGIHYKAYRGGLSSDHIDWPRDIIYIVGGVMVEVYDIYGEKHIVDIGSWEQGPKTVCVNGDLHKYRYWADIPEPFQMALTRRIPYFNERKFRIRISFICKFNFPTMRQIMVPVDLPKILAGQTVEMKTLRSSQASMGSALTRYTKHLDTEAEGGLRGRRVKKGSEPDYHEGEY